MQRIGFPLSFKSISMINNISSNDFIFDKIYFSNEISFYRCLKYVLNNTLYK